MAKHTKTLTSALTLALLFCSVPAQAQTIVQTSTQTQPRIVCAKEQDLYHAAQKALRMAQIAQQQLRLCEAEKHELEELLKVYETAPLQQPTAWYQSTVVSIGIAVVIFTAGVLTFYAMNTM